MPKENMDNLINELYDENEHRLLKTFKQAGKWACKCVMPAALALSLIFSNGCGGEPESIHSEPVVEEKYEHTLDSADARLAIYNEYHNVFEPLDVLDSLKRISKTATGDLILSVGNILPSLVGEIKAFGDVVNNTAGSFQLLYNSEIHYEWNTSFEAQEIFRKHPDWNTGRPVVLIQIEEMKDLISEEKGYLINDEEEKLIDVIKGELSAVNDLYSLANGGTKVSITKSHWNPSTKEWRYENVYPLKGVSEQFQQFLVIDRKYLDALLEKLEAEESTIEPPPTTIPRLAKQAGTIVFASSSYWDGNLLYRLPSNEVWTINPDGSSLKQLTNNATREYMPRWSPDGKMITFVSTDGDFDNLEIFVMNSNGTNIRQLTDNNLADEYPEWSPDGKKILFTSPGEGRWNWEIYVMNPDGSNKVNLTKHPTTDFHGSWSPDGRRIAFIANRDESSEIYVTNPDGTNQQRLTRNKATELFPSWSPDGKRISFISNQDDEFGVYVMNSDGSDQRRLAYVGLDRIPSGWGSFDEKFIPVWSPDAEMIAYVVAMPEHNDRTDVYVINADGTNQTRITYDKHDDYFGAWSPDGKQLAIVKGDAGYDTYIMDVSVIEELRYIQSEDQAKGLIKRNMRRLHAHPGRHGLSMDWSPYLIEK